VSDGGVLSAGDSVIGGFQLPLSGVGVLDLTTFLCGPYSPRSLEWLELFEKADIPAGPINGLADSRSDPHLKATGFFRRFGHPSEGQIEIPDTPYRFDGQSLPVRRGQPRLGEHGREVLAEIGMSEEDIDAALSDTRESHA
jgi:crotonobetainyl-CoA:carnitine CoA-transferase CaiB-like acyl-CoA transferase|tara:strand:- start:29 stop:451 length:423 start_codon:yes stop_codon:yes gene_type:complete